MSAAPVDRLVGRPVPRKEDRRLLTGRGRYTSNLVLPGMVHAVFVRSTAAHADIGHVDVAAARASPGVRTVAVGSDPDVAGATLRAISELPGYQSTDQPVLARRTVRFAGEAVAAVVADTLAQAVDATEGVDVVYSGRPVVVDAVAGSDPGAPLVHEATTGNVLARRHFERGDADAAIGRAAVVVERRFRTNRQAASPMEGRACVAVWHAEQRRLTVHSSTQVPHLLRHGLADILRLPETAIRVVTEDVGGGFGLKTIVYPEDVAVCVLAMRLGRPVKWVETRNESLMSAAHAREHTYAVRAGFAADGELLVLDATVWCNAGAYSVYPWTAAIEPLMAGGLLAGPYRCPTYRCDTLGVATHTAPAGPYRGVARPASTFVMERVLDVAARRLALDPVDIRRRNLVGPGDLPYEAATRLVHDSETYGRCLEAVVTAVDYPSLRRRQSEARGGGVRMGVGFAVYNELTALGRRASSGPRMPFRTGHECMTVRIDPSGGVTVLAGVTSQGQGLETTVAQVVAGELGVGYEHVSVRMGDTDASLFGFGAFSSRQGVIGGGAAVLAARALRERVVAIAAGLLEANPDDLEIVDGAVSVRGVPSRHVTVADVAKVAYLEPHRLPEGMEPGLETTRFFDPVLGTFAAGALATVVEVDEETGKVTVLRAVCAEDAGVRVNPTIVEGQVHGAVAQGIANALYEHVQYSDDGQLLTSTFADYLVPSAAELPGIETHHVDVPSSTNPLGVRGVGEGGTLGPPAAIANAVADALADRGVEVDELPLSPQRVFNLITSAAHPGPVDRLPGRGPASSARIGPNAR